MNALQEEITQKTLALCVEASKMTAQLLQQATATVSIYRLAYTFTFIGTAAFLF